MMCRSSYPRYITVQVLGTPTPKGSQRAISRGGRAILVPSGSDARKQATRSWGQDVRYALAEEVKKWPSPPLFVNQALEVTVTFRLKRPGDHWGKRGLLPSAPPYPATKPDLDKLCWELLDLLNGVVFDDDSRVVGLILHKFYATQEVPEGVTVSVRAL